MTHSQNINILMETIFKECERHFKCDFDHVMWKNSRTGNRKARMAIMYGLKLTGMNLEEIGECFTYVRPHCSVMSAIRQFLDLSYDKTRPLYNLRMAVDAIVLQCDLEAKIAYHEQELERLKNMLDEKNQNYRTQK